MNRWLSAGAIGIAGIAALVAWFPRVDPYAAERIAMGRRQALQRAMQLSSHYGIETAGWRVAITAETDEKLRDYHHLYPDDPVAKTFTPFYWDIALRAPAGKGSVRVVLGADGLPKEWEWKEAAGSPPSTAPGPEPEAILRDFAGDTAVPSVSQTANAGIETRSWEWRAGERFPLVAILDITKQNGRLVSVKRGNRYEDRFASSFPVVAQAVIGSASALAIFVVLVAALLFFARSGRKNLTSRVAPLLAAPFVAWAAWQGLGGQDYQRIAYQQLLGSGDRNGMVGLGIGLMVPVVGMFLFTGAAWSVRSSANRAKWLSLESLVGGRLGSRPVGIAMTAGFAAAAGIAAIPYAVGMLLLPGTMLFHDWNRLADSIPQLEVLDPTPAILQIAVFGFLWQVVARLRSVALRYSVFGLGGVLLAGIARPILFENVGLNLLAACLTFLACFFLYRQFDLLAPMASVCAAHAIRLAAVMVTQPERSLHAAGVQVFVALGVSAGVAALVAWRGGELAPSAGWDDVEAVPLVASDRARLDAEFQVARRAQEAALPAVPPSVGAYGFAASCQPAQQVGGDLYDFFPFPGGRLGVVVADVSGKGVPAALYMMVTKGLLSAGARDSDDLKYLLKEVNLHLYRTCKRKVFVTMAAISLDPAGGRCFYGRAGHNPMIWRRTGRGETRILKSRGLGLGMVASESFGRTLEIQELDLEAGDALVLYSDGITEAVNATMQQYGEQRLLRAVDATDGQSAEAARATILRDLAQFVGTTPPRDDITLVVVRVSAAAPVGDAARELV